MSIGELNEGPLHEEAGETHFWEKREDSQTPMGLGFQLLLPEYASDMFLQGSWPVVTTIRSLASALVTSSSVMVLKGLSMNQIGNSRSEQLML